MLEVVWCASRESGIGWGDSPAGDRNKSGRTLFCLSLHLRGLKEGARMPREEKMEETVTQRVKEIEGSLRACLFLESSRVDKTINDQVL